MAVIVSIIGLKGIERYRVEVEVQVFPGVEGVNVGLPDASVKESKDRVMAALYANGCEVPDKKVVINLSWRWCTPLSSSYYHGTRRIFSKLIRNSPFN
ncbi:magnesium chelatase domain-containing protein [Lentibacillus juripiscarius]|uniref:Magnesium chelatase domain-containing protein n=1 Tax=Lentibacillus juripiscarius TaxID=257446 RepID=A0ABW5V5C6_9BACI